jgi:hypothetical protein
MPRASARARSGSRPSVTPAAANGRQQLFAVIAQSRTPGVPMAQSESDPSHPPPRHRCLQTGNTHPHESDDVEPDFGRRCLWR